MGLGGLPRGASTLRREAGADCLPEIFREGHGDGGMGVRPSNLPLPIGEGSARQGLWGLPSPAPSDLPCLTPLLYLPQPCPTTLPLLPMPPCL